MKFSNACALACAALSATTLAASSDDKPKEKPLKPCTARSATSGSFFDLNELYRMPPSGEDGTAKKGEVEESYQARGWDYGRNFTLNFCGPVVEKLDHVEGVSKGLWRNVSAYYTVGSKTYSIGQQSSDLVLRGRKLVLNYTGGSPCDSGRKKRAPTTDLTPRKLIDGDDDDDDDDDDDRSAPRSGRRKSTIISLLCDKEPPAPKAPLAAVSFIGASEDDCTYFFEARTTAACAIAETSTQGALGPGGVFGVIMVIALLVYFVGGCVYQRTVQNQRGWRQLPNFAMWSFMAGFFMGGLEMLTSSCARFLPGRRGYSRVSLGNGNIRGRHSRSDAENRLIDSLDEEWDD